MASNLVLLRHGQSQWNLDNRFTGWVDVDITEQGREEAREAGRRLKAEGFKFDVAFTSVLKRAIRTLWITLDELDRMWIPVHRSWRLNERHYGALTGLNKAETTAKHGEEQVNIWRRSYDIPPPPLDANDRGHPRFDPRYRRIDPKELPATESLKTTLERVLPYWHEAIVPELKKGEDVLVVAHGNSLRALVKYLDDMSESEIIKLNIPTGIPLLYQLDDNLKPISKRYLADEAKVKAAVEAVAQQAAAKAQ